MRLVRIGLASVNTKVGALAANTGTAIELAHAAAADGCNLVAFQEQLIGGYPMEDLVQWKDFVLAQERQLARFAEATQKLAPVFALGVTVLFDGQRFNCAAAVHRGTVLAFVPKEKLPTYDVFYETRTFSRGWPGFCVETASGVPLGDVLLAFDFGTVALEVCEDIWSPDGPMRRRAYAGAELIVNVSASPFRVGILATRREMLRTRSADSQVAIAYANAVGGNDSLVFDGGGMLVQNGRTLFDAPRFQQGVWAATLDLDRTARLRGENSTFRADWEEHRRRCPEGPRTLRIAADTGDRSALRPPTPKGRSFFLPSSDPVRGRREEFCEEILAAIVLGLGDYFDKVGCFRRLGVAVSGGRDSLLALLIAHRCAAARGVAPDELVQAFTMPSPFTSHETRQAAEAICSALGVPLVTVPIDDAFERELEATRQMLGGGDPDRLTRQNIQARIRGQRMWNWANSAGALFLQTGNMSEKAVGYTTVGGDLEGGLSILSNVPKTVVVHLLEYLAEVSPAPVGEAIQRTLATVAGPELEASQSGEAELMPFEVLDACFYLHAEEKLGAGDVAATLVEMFPDRDSAQLRGWAQEFGRRFRQAIFKWVQAPQSLHLGNLDLERERALQLPVVQGDWDDRPVDG
ncbi:MAG: NAD(+) synthase [Planctomycetes bacterium]|nr:NAD(+) synthase [Planctomycetota bacterium]